VHIRVIIDEFGHLPLTALRPTQVKTWTAKLKADGLAESYIYALHSRLSQVLADAVHDGLLGRNPCSRKTSPPMGRPKVYVATTAQVWALHDAMPAALRVAVLLGAFAGLRVSEAAALRTTDVDFTRGVVTPERQWPDKPLKTDGSAAPIPIPRELTLLLSASVAEFGGEMMVAGGAPWVIERAMRDARVKVDGLPESSRSLTTTCGTTSRRCSSARAPTSRRCKPGCATHRHAPPWTPAATCSRTPTSPLAPPSQQPSQSAWRKLLRSHCGPTALRAGETAGQRPSKVTRRSTARTRTDAAGC